ncbi:MAG: hypothetical protein U0103_23170 [Candidatus Obscuribacterales bacterium]
MVKKKITEAVKSDDAKSKRWRSLFAAGRMAYETGELRQAESLLARAMELAKDIPERTFAVNATEIGTAAILLAQKRTKEAESRLRKSITTLEGESGSTLEELLAVALRFHAQALVDFGDERTAEGELKRSATILGKLGSDAAVQMAYTLCDLCGLYLVQGRISEAEKNILDAMQILCSVLGPEAPEYIRADMIYKLCLPMQSDTMLDTAADGIMQMEYFHVSKHPNIARALGRYMKVLSDRGDATRLEEAKQRFGLKAVAKK